MGRSLPIVAVLMLAMSLHAGEQGSRAMTGWFNVTTPEGWQGKRYMDGGQIFAEEFDSRGTGRIDVWRFYRNGLLSSEERDLTGAGRVDFQSRWDAKNIRLLEVLRDTNRRGVNDLEIEAEGQRRWVVREDRNLDGIADRILYVNGPVDLFDRLGIDLTSEPRVIDSIPRDYWAELWTDDAFTGRITAYYRFTRGEVSHRGHWNGRKVVWSRGGAEYLPPPPPAPRPPERPLPPGPLPAAPLPADLRSPVVPGDVRDPFDLQSPGLDPYEGIEYAAPARGPYGRSDTTPAPGPVYQPDPYPVAPGVRDRTRYEGLPPGESAARSVPARMRPPGVGGQ